MRVLNGAGVFTRPAAGQSVDWAEHLRVADLSVGTYSVPREAADGQWPHTEDEIYVVTAGSATLETDGRSVAVGPGSVVYVPAGESHRFTNVTQNLAVLVIFAPAEYSRQDAGD